MEVLCLLCRLGLVLLLLQFLFIENSFQSRKRFKDLFLLAEIGFTYSFELLYKKSSQKCSMFPVLASMYLQMKLGMM
jgi:hypothetical protein